MFEVVDLTASLPKEEYRRRLPGLQDRLFALQQACWSAAIPVVVVFEGWDAAGKGDCISKLTQRLEPRGFDLHHVTDEPRTRERGLPWMWWFWVRIPGRGQMAIFDRSWNRRALIRRVEGEAGEMDWRRRLRDIGDFERWLAADGYLLVKLFLHISEDEQKRRYKKWRQDPGESWKALEGAWQEPARYAEHLAASEELLQHTEAEHAPWRIVAATDHRWARVRVFELLSAALERGLAAHGVPLPGPGPASGGDEEE